MTMFDTIGQFLAALIGTICFVCLFGVQRRYYLFSGLIGAAGWMLYYVLMHLTRLSLVVDILFATMLIAFLSRMISVWEKCPVTVFLIAGIFPLVPGAGIYWTAYYLVTNQTSQAISSGFAAIKTAIAIVFGIVVILEIPNKFFHLLDTGKKRVKN